MYVLGMGGPQSIPASGPIDLGLDPFEIVACAAVGLLLIVVVAVYRRYISEVKAWRGSRGRSVFWPLLR